MISTKLELTTAQGVIGLAVVQTVSMFRDAAPALADLRHAPAGDFSSRQLLLDAEIFGGLAAVLIGGSAALLTRDTLPLLLAASGLLLISLYYRSVLASPDPATVTGAANHTAQAAVEGEM